MSSKVSDNSSLFKGIALFTPGGDLVYCIDPSKQSRWHLHLCAVLQDILGLPEPPHFLVPAYTATIDQWLDNRTNQIQVVAAIYPLVVRHQNLLNAIFGTNIIWPVVALSETNCDPLLIATYHEQFPQLWENHNLLVKVSSPSLSENNYQFQKGELMTSVNTAYPESDDVSTMKNSLIPGYVLRLYISGNNLATERTLKNLHQVLENALSHPYTLKVTDVFKHPEQAELDQISATPTLVRVWPLPTRRIVGECDDMEMILRLLEVSEWNS